MVLVYLLGAFVVGAMAMLGLLRLTAQDPRENDSERFRRAQEASRVFSDDPSYLSTTASRAPSGSSIATSVGVEG
jgi:hypothetical protein